MTCREIMQFRQLLNNKQIYKIMGEVVVYVSGGVWDGACVLLIVKKNDNNNNNT